MPTSVNINGVWRTASAIQSNIGDVWRNGDVNAVNIDGVYRSAKSSTPLGSKAVGDVIKIKENSVLTNYIVVHKGAPSSLYHAADFDNTVWVLRQDVLDNRQWHNTELNDYANSDIKVWLNNESTGYLSIIDSAIRSQIKTIRIPYRPGVGPSTTVSSGISGLSCKAYLLSMCEIGIEASSYIAAEGAKLSYFIADTDSGAINKRISYRSGFAAGWWLRSPKADDFNGVFNVLTTGHAGVTSPSYSTGIRPVLVLPATTLIGSDGNVL